MILLIITLVFVIGYIAIALEHPLHINKAASALLTGVLCWSLYALNVGSIMPESKVPKWFVAQLEEEHQGENKDHSGDQADSKKVHDNVPLHFLVEGQLGKSMAEVAGVLFFLLGAMTIVELVDAFEGFSVITDKITGRSKLKLLWVISFIAFFLSAVLDNLTTTIVMISLTRKLVRDHQTRLFFAGMIVCAANAGGAWTVIGDVTTTLLWMAEKISTVEVMIRLIIPSLICLVIPLAIISMGMRGEVERPEVSEERSMKNLTIGQQRLMFFLGLSGLLFVPIFKMITHLPPYMGMLLSLSVIWIVTEIIRKELDEYTKSSTHVLEILKRVDSSAILFFLGILLAINCLASTGLLKMAAEWLNDNIGNLNLVAVLIGLISSVVDNVPLVAAGIKMYPFEMDHPFWQFLAYTAGTGGSCLIIGSAAGVAAMGMERIDFLWYVRKITPWALIGYFAGAGVYYLMEPMFTKAGH